ncbi:hypothetical protein M8C21_011322, partial [Ambrosia artemisiifolia]
TRGGDDGFPVAKLIPYLPHRSYLIGSSSQPTDYGSGFVDFCESLLTGVFSCGGSDLTDPQRERRPVSLPTASKWSWRSTMRRFQSSACYQCQRHSKFLHGIRPVIASVHHL